MRKNNRKIVKLIQRLPLRAFVFLFALSGLFSFFYPCDVGAETAPQKVFIIPVAGDVEPAMSAFLDRALRDTAEFSDALLVIEMDTFGGRVDAALQMVESLLRVSPQKTVAYVSNKAISAGALIALASNDLVMRPNTTIGDCAPIVLSEDGPKMMGEKFQSPLRAKFRTLARRNNYPARLAESMVTADMEVFRIEKDGEVLFLDGEEYADLTEAEKETITSKKTIVAKGELLTMDDTEAHELGFSRMTASSIEEMLDNFGIDNYQITRIEQNWSESMGRLIVKLSPILLMLGFAALYTELKAPGFGAPGIFGIICLGLVFLNQYLVGLADYTELLILVLGILFLAVEFFVLPGFGLAGLAGFVCIGASMILAFQDFVIPNPDIPWQGDIFAANIIQTLGTLILAFLASLFFIRYVLPQFSKVVKGPYLDATLADSHADSHETQKIQVGDCGRAISFLRPSGKMEIENDIVDVVTEGDFIEKDTVLTVTAIKGNIITVRRQDS